MLIICQCKCHIALVLLRYVASTVSSLLQGHFVPVERKHAVYYILSYWLGKPVWFCWRTWTINQQEKYLWQKQQMRAAIMWCQFKTSESPVSGESKSAKRRTQNMLTLFIYFSYSYCYYFVSRDVPTRFGGKVLGKFFCKWKTQYLYIYIYKFKTRIER